MSTENWSKAALAVLFLVVVIYAIASLLRDRSKDSPANDDNDSLWPKQPQDPRDPDT